MERLAGSLHSDQILCGMKLATLFTVFLVGVATCMGELFKPSGHVKDLRALGINIEKAERKGDVIQFEIVLPARTTFKNRVHNVSNSFSSVTLLHNAKGPDPDPQRVRDQKANGRLKTKKDDSGKYRAQVRVDKKNWENTYVDIRYENDPKGNPLILGFSLLRIFEQVEKEAKESS